MSKIVIRNRREETIVINKLSFPEAVNKSAYNAIASGEFEGILPVALIQKRRKTTLECYVHGLIPLKQLLGKTVKKEDFLNLVYQIILIIKSCGENRINENNLDLQEDRIFIDPAAKKVKCIYWPVVNNRHSDPPYLFLKRLPHVIGFNQSDDTSYLKQYDAFFEGYAPFSIRGFEQFILELQGRKTLPNPFKTPGESSRASEKEPKADDEASRSDRRIEYDPFSSDCQDGLPTGSVTERKQQNILYCDICGAKNRSEAAFCFACGSKLNITEKKYDRRPTTDVGSVNSENNNDGGTVVLEYGGQEDRKHPILIRNKTEEAFTVNKPVFRIGREQGYCDLLISDNKYIGHRHAEIITRDSHHYIVDKNSMNGTYIDGKAIRAETEVEIFDGTQIKFADEEFLFLSKK